MHINRNNNSFYAETCDYSIGGGSQQLVPLWRIVSSPIMDFWFHQWVAWEPALSWITNFRLCHCERGFCMDPENGPPRGRLEPGKDRYVRDMIDF